MNNEKVRVLVADDNKDFCNILKDFLSYPLPASFLHVHNRLRKILPEAAYTQRLEHCALPRQEV